MPHKCRLSSTVRLLAWETGKGFPPCLGVQYLGRAWEPVWVMARMSWLTALPSRPAHARELTGPRGKSEARGRRKEVRPRRATPERWLHIAHHDDAPGCGHIVRCTAAGLKFRRRRVGLLAALLEDVDFADMVEKGREGGEEKESRARFVATPTMSRVSLGERREETHTGSLCR